MTARKLVDCGVAEARTTVTMTTDLAAKAMHFEISAAEDGAAREYTGNPHRFGSQGYL